MSVFVLLCIAVGVFTAAMFALSWVKQSDAAGLLCLAGIVVLLVLGLIAAIIYGGRAVGRTTCRNWSAQTGYATKFRVLNWSDTGTCLVLAPNGRWVKNTQVIINVPSKP